MIATCRLVACVPTEHVTVTDGDFHREPYLRSDPRLFICGREREFGDYTPGRWAWLLDDVQALAEPVPARGALGVWEWERAS